MDKTKHPWATHCTALADLTVRKHEHAGAGIAIKMPLTSHLEEQLGWKTDQLSSVCGFLTLNLLPPLSANYVQF